MLFFEYGNMRKKITGSKKSMIFLRALRVLSKEHVKRESGSMLFLHALFLENALCISKYSDYSEP